MPFRSLFYIILLLSGIFPASYGEIPESFTPSQSEIRQRSVSETQMKKYAKDRDFDYGENYKLNERSGFFARLLQKVLRFIAGFFEVIGKIPWIFQVILLAAALLIVFIIARKTKLYRMFYKDHEIQQLGFQEIELSSSEFDFDKEISKEFSRKNYRNAVRLLHLKILKILASNGMIHPGKDKTNRDYLKEIRDENLRMGFMDLTGIYNQIWYGHYPLSEEDYNRFAGDFNHFTQTVYAIKE